MMANSDILPKDVLTALLPQGGRPGRMATLNKLDAICRRHSENGTRSFSIKVIGRIADHQGLLKGRIPYNVPSADYRALIVACANYSGSTISPKVVPASTTRG